MKRHSLLLLFLALSLLPGCKLLSGKDTAGGESAAAPEPVNEAGRHDLPAPPAEGDRFVGLAVSGGGSRAAVFTAAVLRELSKIEAKATERDPGASFLDQVDAMSSVSGGSLSSAYYCMRRPGRGAGGEELSEFFDTYLKDMRRNFIKDLALGALLDLEKALNLLEDRAARMARHWESLGFFGQEPGTLADLAKRQVAGDCPVLLLNATRYDNGKKFVIGTVKEKKLNARNDLWKELTEAAKRTGDPLRISTLETIGSAPGPFPVSFGVAASASFPNLMGPVVLANHTGSGYLHLGDGGIYDNLGLETLLQYAAGRLVEPEQAPKSAFILVIDTGKPFTEEPAEEPGGTNPLTTIERVVAMVDRRANLFAMAYFETFRDRMADAHTPIRILRVSPFSLTREDGLTKKEIRTLEEIPTSFHIAEEHAALLEKAARIAVRKAQKDLRQAVSQ